MWSRGWGEECACPSRTGRSEVVLVVMVVVVEGEGTSAWRKLSISE